MVKLLWIFGLRAFESIWECLKSFVVNFWHEKLLFIHSISRDHISNNDSALKKFLFIYSISRDRIRNNNLWYQIQCYQLFIGFWKLMTDQKFWKPIQTTKNEHMLDVFRFKLSTDQKDIIIFLWWVKSRKVLFR